MEIWGSMKLTIETSFISPFFLEVPPILGKGKNKDIAFYNVMRR